MAARPRGHGSYEDRAKGRQRAMILTESIVRGLLEAELQRARALYPEPGWVHPFRSLDFNSACQSYGHAHADGRVVLSRCFLGLDARDDLVDTIRHELAHLIAGIREKHGPAWKAVARRLGCAPRATNAARSQGLTERMGTAPLRLLAVTSDGETVDLKPAHRRLTKYASYRPTPRLRYHLRDGRLIARFRYEKARGPAGDTQG